MGCGNLMIFVLDQVQVLDQEIAAPRPVAEQQFDLVPRRSDRPDGPWGVDFGPLFVPAPGCSNERTFCTS